MRIDAYNQVNMVYAAAGSAQVKKQYESGKYSVSANKLAAKLMEKYSTIAF